MNIHEARAIHEGDYIASKYDVPEYRVCRVTRVWQDVGSSMVRVQCQARGAHWFELSKFAKVPRKHVDGRFYRIGDTLDVNQRPESQNVENSPEAISDVDNGGGSPESFQGSIWR